MSKLPSLSEMTKAQMEAELKERRAQDALSKLSTEAAFSEYEEELEGLRHEKDTLLRYFLARFDEEDLQHA